MEPNYYYIDIKNLNSKICNFLQKKLLDTRIISSVSMIFDEDIDRKLFSKYGVQKISAIKVLSMIKKNEL